MTPPRSTKSLLSWARASLPLSNSRTHLCLGANLESQNPIYTLIHGVTPGLYWIPWKWKVNELRVDPPHQLSLTLPMNISYADLKRILVAEGITLQVRKALEVSFHYSSNYDLPMDGSMTLDEYASDFRPFMLSSTCIQLIYVRISLAPRHWLLMQNETLVYA